MNKIFILLFLLLTFNHSEPITPLFPVEDINVKKAKLGKKLFFDPILSVDNTISCASCHDIFNGGDDGRKFSIGIKGRVGDINAPTVFNSVYNFRQFWDGRAETLFHQTWGPIENPVEMGNTFAELKNALEKTPYKYEFEQIYDDGITKENISDAIVEYEKTLVTLNSPFDRYIKGDENAITDEQKEGYRLFKDNGCIACHHGKNVGSNLYNKFGVMKEAKSLRLGRYDVTKKEEDKYYFKVPTLRNINQTAPYLHDGRYDNLEDVVKFMAKYQLGRTISEEEIKKIVSFLDSLTGEIPESTKP
jgi:cytochrome c peroxidase